MPNVDLRCGDCLELMKEIPDGSIDAVITDPPYGIGIASNPFRQKFKKQEWDDSPMSQECLDEIRRISKEQIIWGGNYFNLPPSQGFLIWDKVQPFDFSSAMCEQAWCSKQMPAKMFRYRVTGFEKVHPTQKPEPLMIWCVEFLPQGATILDPFMGSGTTGVACVKTGRNFIGFELDPQYFAIAEKRIHDALAQQTLDLSA
jgi:site-specific DNA-methyltransferase (adenine-specific)